MPYVKSISVYDAPARTVDYITQEGKLNEINKDASNAGIFFDGVSHENLTAKIIQSAKNSGSKMEIGNQPLFDYVINEAKTEDKDSSKKYVSTQNCAIPTAPVDFENIQRLRTGRAANYTKGKRDIKAHHLVQSFKIREGTPESVHQVGLETAYKFFGTDAQIVVATHTDQGHLHNHILVNSVDLNGNKITMGKVPLRNLRTLSDTISHEYGFSIIMPRDNFADMPKGMHYKTWLKNNPDKNAQPATRQRNRTWFDKVRLDIDRAIVASNDFDDFLTQLHKNGYKTKGGNTDGRMYLAIAQQSSSKYTRTKTLGANYTEEMIRERIADPDKHSIFIKEESSRQGKLSKFTDFASKRKSMYMASGAVLRLQYLSTLEILFRLIVNNVFKESKKFDLSSPYGLFNDYHFAKHLIQLLFLERNNIQTKEDYSKLKNMYSHMPVNKEDILAMFDDINETIEGFDIAKGLANQKNAKIAPKAINAEEDIVAEQKP